MIKSLFAIALATISLFLHAEVFDVTQNNYNAVVEQSENPIIIDFYATWCPHCRRMATVFENASTRYPNIRFVKIDIDREPALAKRFEVERLPTLLYFLPKQSSPSFRSTGFLSQEALDENIARLQKLSK